jgi:hypothetical protein
VRLGALLVVGCTRAATPTTDAASSPLEGCIPEKHPEGTTYSCGAGFLAMDAPVSGPMDRDVIKENLDAFSAPFGKDVVSSDDRPFEGSPAVRLTMQPADNDRFFAMMVVIPGAKRVLTCSAKQTEAARCEAVLRYLMNH